MHPIRTLLGKEFRHNGRTFLVLSALLAVALGILLWNSSRATRVLSLLDLARFFLIVFHPLAAMVLSHRMVVREYHGRTQQFLEGLPIRRIHMVTVKFGLGLAYLIAAILGVLGVLALLALRSEPVGALFVAILVLKSASLVFLVWAVVFSLAFTGRLRIPIYIGSFLVLMFLDSFTEFELQRMGPLALLDAATFAFERQEVAWGPLLQTNLAALCFTGLAVCLALIREGTVAEALSRKMTQREKITAGALALAATMGFALFEEKKTKQPYRFQGNAVVRSESLPISIMYSSDWLQPDAEKLLVHLERSLGTLADALQIDTLPPTRIIYGFTLDRQTYETAELERADGLLVRANFDDLSVTQRDDLEAYIIRGVLDHATRRRSRYEPKRWLHDGFSRWWADQGTDDVATAPDPVLIARAAVAARYIEEFSPAVPKWDLLRERVGEPLAEALAYCGLEALEERAGREAVLDLARSVLGRTAPDDVRETLYEWFHPMAAVFSASTGEDWDDFLIRWEQWIEARTTQPAVADLLDQIPDLTGSFEVHPGEGAIRIIAARFADVEAVAIGEPGRTTAAPCSLLHRKLSPFDHQIHPKTLLREERDCSLPAGSFEIAGRYGPGERVFLALEFIPPALGVPVRIAARRLVIE